MKNTNRKMGSFTIVILQAMRSIAIIAIVAIIGFSMIACGDGGNGGNVIPVKLRFSNSGTAPANSIQIAVSRSIPPPNYSVTIDTDSFKIYDDMYALLGEKVGDGITPSEFQIISNFIFLTSSTNPDKKIDLITVGELIDFKNPQTILASEGVEPGIYDVLVAYLSLSGGSWSGVGELHTKITFPFPKDINESEHPFTRSTFPIFGTPLPLVNGNLSLRLSNLEVASIHNQLTGGTGHLWGFDQIDAVKTTTDTVPGGLYGMILHGDTRKLVTTNHNGIGNDVLYSDLSPTLPDNMLFGGLPGDSVSFIAVPFAGITIPEEAAAVRFEIRWNLDNIIERRQGATASLHDDIFVLRHGWWEGLSVEAVIE